MLQQILKILCAASKNQCSQINKSVNVFKKTKQCPWWSASFKNMLCNAGDTSSISGPEGPLWGSWACVAQLLSWCSGAHRLQLLSPCAAATEDRTPRTCAQPERPAHHTGGGPAHRKEDPAQSETKEFFKGI